ncbi:MAG: biotin-dependent carboxyltransferase family protein [Rhodobacteraceae bacterium]|nr:biotin-dependent carboxyltransferase family protein [Paracoccaceae bacterium]
MTRRLIVHRCGPGITVQDMGRPGALAYGLSRGGAADRLALAEGAALLGQPDDLAALELPGSGGEFEIDGAARIALTGAPMKAEMDGAPLAWNACHAVPQGARIRIGGATAGSYGYLHLGGGIATRQVLGSRAAHLTAGIGGTVQPGDRLPLGADPAPDRHGYVLPADARFDGGTVRIVEGPQTAMFSASEQARFARTAFRRDTRGNRMGVRLLPPEAGFADAEGLSVLSEPIVPGDIQITGDGTPFVLLTECQTTGGYPRIGTVLPADLPRVAQMRPGATLAFEWVDHAVALGMETAEHARRAGLRRMLQRLVRDPAQMRDLLSYQLIDGVTAGHDDPDLPA